MILNKNMYVYLRLCPRTQKCTDQMSFTKYDFHFHANILIDHGIIDQASKNPGSAGTPVPEKNEVTESNWRTG